MRIKTFGGIDPGLSGAIAIIGDGVVIHDMPMNYLGTFIDSNALLALCNQAEVIWLEQVASRPTDGRSSLAKFMVAYGVTRACMEISNGGWRSELILPQQWKKRLGLIKQPKEASLELARSLYPEAAHYLKRKKDHNRAEALLIAHLNKQYYET